MYYENSVCLEDLSKVSMWGTWFDTDFKNIAISITACDKDTYEGKDGCKDVDEIDRFLKENIFYTIF